MSSMDVSTVFCQAVLSFFTAEYQFNLRVGGGDEILS